MREDTGKAISDDCNQETPCYRGQVSGSPVWLCDCCMQHITCYISLPPPSCLITGPFLHFSDSSSFVLFCLPSSPPPPPPPLRLLTVHSCSAWLFCCSVFNLCKVLPPFDHLPQLHSHDLKDKLHLLAHFIHTALLTDAFLEEALSRL